MPTICRRTIAYLACLTVVLSVAVSAQVLPVTVDKVEPPSWRSGSSSELILCLRGSHLDRVVGVATKHKGVRVMRTESPDANRLLVWLRISPDAAPGTMVLQISTHYLTTFALVPMFEPASPSSRGELTAGK